MCGLVGAITKNRNGFSTLNMDMFETLLFMDQLRGFDSTGVFLVNNIGNVMIAKEACNASDFIPTPQWKSVRGDGFRNGWAMIGHNRKATRGNITDENAHPFWVEDKIVLVHNGTMYGDHKQHAEVEVDSHAIAHILAEEEDVEKAMQKINAAYALMWYNVGKKQINILRNSQRPLTWMEVGDAYFFASEPSMMIYAAMRHNVEILNDGPHEFNPNELDVWSLKDDKSTTCETTKLDCAFKSSPKVAESAPNFPSEPHTNLFPHPHSCGYSSDCGDNIIEDGAERLKAAAAAIAAQEAIENARSEPRLKLMTFEPEDVPTVTEVVNLPASTPDPVSVQINHTFAEWEKIRLEYPDGMRLKVEVNDYLPDDAGAHSVFLVGRTCDHNKLHVIFPVEQRLFKAIMDPTSDVGRERKSVFSVEVNGCKWKKTGAPAPRFEDTVGYIAIHGRTGAKLVVGAGSRVQ